MYAQKVDWQIFKSFINNKNLSPQIVHEDSSAIRLIAIDGSFVAEVKLYKTTPETTDYQDFDTNYRSQTNRKLSPIEVSGVKDPKGMRARLVKLCNNNITAGQTVNIDWQIPDVQWNGVSKQTYFDGLKYKAANSSDGDKVTFQVVDKDGILYPAGTVLEEFATDWPIFSDEHEDINLYKAKLLVGMYIRVIYTSTGQSNVNFIAGLYRHLDDTKDL